MASLTGEFGNSNASRTPSRVQTAASEDLAVDPRAVGQIVAKATPEQQADLAKTTQAWNEHFRVGKHDVPDWVLPFLAVALGGPFALQAMGVGAAGAAGAGAAGAGGTALGAAIPSTVAGLVPTSTALGAGSAAAQMGAALAGGLGAAGTAAGAGALGTALAEVSPVIITATKAGFTVPQIAAAMGVPALAVSNVLQNAAGSNVMQGGEAGDTLGQPGDGTTIDELVITADKLNPATWTDLVPVGTIGSGILAKGVADGLGAELNPVDRVDPNQISEGVEKGVGYETPLSGELFTDTIVGQTIPSNVEGLKTTADALGPGSPAGQLGSKIAAGEIVDKVLKGAEIANKVAPLISAAGGGGSDSKTGGGIPPSFAAAGTSGSLSDKFRANLPAPSGPFGNLAARDVAMTPEQWKTYGARPEQSFFANVPIRPSGIIDTSKRAPPTPGPEEAKGFRTGGFAVRGPGTGRSDEIPARLSDGEYVIDAETVALLGDGSTQAGSKRLDDFRVNIRKHKGRQLSKGKFSHNARKPEAYLHGGRV